ncbi:MAG TPA: alanine--tRNA ligase-related protein, partial [Caulobacterales bacterium]|nr:alanine--tRNA ligase-related protein [Caulobacterales bacterium]
MGVLDLEHRPVREADQSAIAGLAAGFGVERRAIEDQFGFPLDLTQDILRRRGQTVDTAGFDKAMEEQRERGREAWAGSGEAATEDVWLGLQETIPPTEFLGYASEEGRGKLLAVIAKGARQER